MTTKTMLIIGSFVLVAAVVIPVVFFQGENTTKTVAVAGFLISLAGFLISLGKTLYNVFDKERERKKKSQESQERVKVTARYGHWDSTGTELGVVIYNLYFPRFSPLSCGQAEQPLGDGLNFLLGDPWA